MLVKFFRKILYFSFTSKK